MKILPFRTVIITVGVAVLVAILMAHTGGTISPVAEEGVAPSAGEITEPVAGRPSQDAVTRPPEPPFTEAGDLTGAAKGARRWLPQIEDVVDEAVRAGLLREDERRLWIHVLLGVVGVESAGKAELVGAPNSQNPSRGLTQLIGANLHADENPFDPATNLRVALRTIVRYYRQWDNRWDRAVAQHLTGAEGEQQQRYGRDGNGMSGEDYVRRLVAIVWQAGQVGNGDEPAQGGARPRRQDFNWQPPEAAAAYWYAKAGVDDNSSRPVARDTWLAAPEWFYGG